MTIALYKTLCAILMLFIQCGFLLLESGMTREKNSHHVAIKNLVNFFLGSLIFSVVGIHFARILDLSLSSNLDLILAASFCSISTTIVSGSITERCRFESFLIMIVAASAIIYPVAAFLCWSPEGPFLGQGFIDKAGSTGVHISGGAMALAAAIVIGPRKNFFSRGEDTSPVPASNMSLACLASLFMLIGWFGFNLGSMDPSQPLDIDKYVTNIFLGALSGSLAGLALGRSRKGQYDIASIINGSISGLVATTAGFHILSSHGSVVLGCTGAAASVLASKGLLKLRIDDSIGAFPVHFAAGMVGTLGLVFFREEAFTWNSLFIQSCCALVVAVWSFLSMYFLLLFIDRKVFKLRVSDQAEQEGLNVSEHNAPSLADLLCREIDQHMKTLDFSRPASSEPFTKIGRIADQYNRLTTKFQQVLSKSLEEFSRLSEIGLQAAGIAHDIRTPLQILSAQSYLLSEGRMSHEEQINASAAIARECQRMEKMCALLLDRAHSKSRTNDERSNLQDVMQELAYLQREPLSKSGIQLELPPENPSVQMEQSDLVRVLNGLITNSKKALESFSNKEKNLWIRIRSEQDGPMLLIYVEDNGPGIPEDQQDRIFHLYLSNEHVHRQHGFGLAICESLLARNNARIHLEKRENPTTFKLTIPIFKERSCSL